MKGILIPQNIFIGDTAQFLFLLSEQESAELIKNNFVFGSPIPLKNITQNEMMSIKDIRLITRENGQYLQITFVPWETGEINFPSLSFLRLKQQLPSIHISSLLEQSKKVSLQPPKPPLLIPGTDYLLYGAIITGIGCILLFGTAVWFLFQKFQKKMTLRTAKKRISILRKNLRRLHKEARKIQKNHISVNTADMHETENFADSIRNWYTSIDHSLREYIQAICTEHEPALYADNKNYFLSATYTELIEKLSDLFESHPRIPDLFRILYTMLEKQRFGSIRADLIRDYTAVSQDILKKAAYIAEKTESEYAVLIHNRKKTEEEIPTVNT